MPQAGGEPTAWATGTALDSLPASEGGFGIGVNGLKVRDGAVWVSNTDRGTLLRIPVRRDGSAGTIETRATGLTGIDDFAFAGRNDDTILVAIVFANEVALVRPDGTHSVVLTREDGLSSPNSVAVGKQSVYVPSSAAFFTDEEPNLLLARLN